MLNLRPFQATYSRPNPPDGVLIWCTEEDVKNPKFYEWLESAVITRFSPRAPRIINFMLPGVGDKREISNG